MNGRTLLFGILAPTQTPISDPPKGKIAEDEVKEETGTIQPTLVLIYPDRLSISGSETKGLLTLNYCPKI